MPLTIKYSLRFLKVFIIIKKFHNLVNMQSKSKNIADLEYQKHQIDILSLLNH